MILVLSRNITGIGLSQCHGNRSKVKVTGIGLRSRSPKL